MNWDKYKSLAVLPIVIPKWMNGMAYFCYVCILFLIHALNVMRKGDWGVILAFDGILLFSFLFIRICFRRSQDIINTLHCYTSLLLVAAMARFAALYFSNANYATPTLCICDITAIILAIKFIQYSAKYAVEHGRKTSEQENMKYVLRACAIGGCGAAAARLILMINGIGENAVLASFLAAFAYLYVLVLDYFLLFRLILKIRSYNP